MRTWRQGIVGVINSSHSIHLYVHCLKYPLAKIYRDYEFEHQTLVGYMFSVMVDKTVLKNIDRLGERKLSKEEKDEGGAFRFDSKENKVYLRNHSGEEGASMERLYAAEELIEKYLMAMNK